MTEAVDRSWMSDALAAFALFAVVVGYLAALPLNLQSPDEARYLDHAKRLLDGEVLYRDVFDITMPGWVFLMTGMFAVFGTTLAVARDVDAVIHGATAVTMFAICRRLGVRRALAWSCAAAAVIVTQRIFAGASYHCLATFLCTVIVLVCLLSSRSVGWAWVTGILLGLLVAVHQQRGGVFTAGIGAWLVAQWALDRLHGHRRGLRALGTQLVALATGIALVLVPLLVALAAWAGIAPVWQCIVATPLMNYRKALHSPWGNTWGGMNAGIAVTRYAPFALVPTVAMALVFCWRRTAPEVARREVLLAIVGAASLLSIGYFPDIVHLALVAPIFLIMIATLLEMGLAKLPAQTGRVLGAMMAVAVVGSVAIGAYQVAADLRSNFRIPYETAFGRIDLGAEMAGVDIGQRQVDYYDQLRALVDATPGRVLYVHPRAIYTNLLVDAHNPTRFDLVWAPLYTPPDQVQEVVAALRDKQVPYILWSPIPPPRPEDLVAQFIRTHYEQATEPLPLAESLWKLKRGPRDDGRQDG